MGWFTRIDTEILEWEVEHWKWLIRNLSPNFNIRHLRLITPTPVHFPIKWSAPEKTALDAFQCVQKHFGIESWPCRLEPFEEVDDVAKRVAPVLARPEKYNGAAGLFEVNPSNEVIIKYKPEQVADPLSLIATMSHELSHYVVATIREEPPDGWDNLEPITDLTAVFFGFGIFLANSTFRFTQWQDNQHQGWSAKSQGYLSEEALSLGLALFCHWKGIAPREATSHLTTNPKHYFNAYYKEFGKKHMNMISEFRQ